MSLSTWPCVDLTPKRRARNASLLSSLAENTDLSGSEDSVCRCSISSRNTSISTSSSWRTSLSSMTASSSARIRSSTGAAASNEEIPDSDGSIRCVSEEMRDVSIQLAAANPTTRLIPMAKMSFFMPVMLHIGIFEQRRIFFDSS